MSSLFDNVAVFRFVQMTIEWIYSQVFFAISIFRRLIQDSQTETNPKVEAAVWKLLKNHAYLLCTGVYLLLWIIFLWTIVFASFSYFYI